jgi:hypothetical protein
MFARRKRLKDGEIAKAPWPTERPKRALPTCFDSATAPPSINNHDKLLKVIGLTGRQAMDELVA